MASSAGYRRSQPLGCHEHSGGSPKQSALESTRTAHDRYEDDRGRRRRIGRRRATGGTGAQGGFGAGEQWCRRGGGSRCRAPALLPDDLYTAAGASIGDAWSADVVVRSLRRRPPRLRLRAGQTLIGFPRRATPTTRSVPSRAPASRPSPQRRSHGSPGLRRWMHCPRRPTSPDTNRCCSPPVSPPDSSRC